MYSEAKNASRLPCQSQENGPSDILVFPKLWKNEIMMSCYPGIVGSIRAGDKILFISGLGTALRYSLIFDGFS
jgi:hypothetical protein